MKQYVWKRGGKWHISVATIVGGTTVYWWPRGVGNTIPAAYADYLAKQGARV